MNGSSAAPRGPSSVLRAAGAMGIATFFSRILGLVREQVFAVMFGAGDATDAFNVAFRIPNLLRDLFAEGAMSSSLVPTFTAVREKEGAERAWRVAGRVFRILFALVSVLAAIGILLAPWLVELYAGAFARIPGKFELTVKMTRMMFPFFPLVALAAAFMGILNACGVFFLPAFASALFNLTSIIVGIAAAKLIPHLGWAGQIHPIEGMAIGVVAGGAVQAFCQLPALYRVGYRWVRAGQEQGSDGKQVTAVEPYPSWRDDPALKRILWMMIPGTIGLAATQINILVNTILATSQGPGAVSWLNYAFRLMQFPIGVFGVSLAAATLPVLSALWVKRDVEGVERTLTQSLKQVFAINLPASAGLAFLGVPILELIFQYGRFTASDTEATALALAMYAIGLTAYSAVKVLVPACYALGNTRVPVISSVMAVGVTIGLNLLMVGPFGYWGLALGTSIAAVMNAAFLVGAVKKLIEAGGGRFSYRPLAKSLFQHGVIALTMGAICWGSARELARWFPEEAFRLNLGNLGLVLYRFFRTGLLVTEGVAVVIILSRLLGVTETTEALQLFVGKLKKKLSRSRS